MIKEYTPSKHMEETVYKIQFYSDASGGFAFDCDENGNLLPSVTKQARKNYAWCLKHPEKYPYSFNKVVKKVINYKEPATGICNCGNKIYLQNEYMGACECSECGQLWNIFGQELKPLNHWNDYGEMNEYD